MTGLGRVKFTGGTWASTLSLWPPNRKLFVVIFVKDCLAAVGSVAAGGGVAVVNHVVGGGGGRQSGVFAFQSTVGQHTLRPHPCLTASLRQH